MVFKRNYFVIEERKLHIGIEKVITITNIGKIIEIPKDKLKKVLKVLE